ncbi:MAG TPA: 30S ribosomal protein S2 [Verrucomicrobiae bacterium]|nr:30S ribosomal protein S2 [Verrucomicrobiae bacterium]
MPTVSIPELRELMQAGVHFGHASGRWHPKMAPYIFATRDKLHIMNLEKTQEQLATVLPLLEERARQGKMIVLVGTKKQASPLVAEIGARLGIPYVSERWLGGTMTNWAEMQASIARMKRVEGILADEEQAGRMIKKERVAMEGDLKRMRVKFGGIRDLTRKPDVLFVIDPSYEHNAIKECRDEGLEIFGICDTNSNPTQLDHVIPANDDGPKSLKLVLGMVEQAIAAGLEARGKEVAKAEKEKADAAEKAEKAEAAPVAEKAESAEKAAPAKEAKSKK